MVKPFAKRSQILQGSQVTDRLNTHIDIDIIQRKDGYYIIINDAHEKKEMGVFKALSTAIYYQWALMEQAAKLATVQVLRTTCTVH